MGNKVTVELTAIDKISDVTKTIGGSFTELNSALQLLDRALQAVGKAYDATVGVAQEYNLSITKMAQNIGATTEETSKIVQVSDDFGVSQEAVTTALQLGVKNGFVPTIESLATLSEEYLALQDPAQQAAMMSEKFGRNWAALTPLLKQGGEVIREQANSIEASLIVTGEASVASEKLRVEQDKLNDAIEAVKVSVGNKAIPFLSNYVQLLNNVTNGTMDATEAIALYNREQWKIGPPKTIQYGTELTKDFTAAQLDASDAIVQTGTVLGGMTDVLNESNQGLIDREKRLKILTDAEKAEVKALQNVATAVSGPIKKAYDDYSQKIADIRNKQGELTEAIKDALRRGWDKTSDKVRDLQREYDDLSQAEDNAVQSMEEVTKAMIFQQAAAGLTAKQARELALALGIMSQTDYDFLTITEDLNTQFLNTGDMSGYKEALLLLNDALKDGVIDAAEKEKILNRMNGKNYQITVTTTWIDKGAPQNQLPPEGPTGPTGPKDDLPQQSFGGGGKAGNTSVVINQYFSNADPATVKVATRDGINEAARQLGMR
jgi:hypothetical protein